MLFAAKRVPPILTNDVSGSIAYHFEFNAAYKAKLNYCRNQLWFSGLIIDFWYFTGACTSEMGKSMGMAENHTLTSAIFDSGIVNTNRS